MWDKLCANVWCGEHCGDHNVQAWCRKHPPFRGTDVHGKPDQTSSFLQSSSKYHSFSHTIACYGLSMIFCVLFSRMTMNQLQLMLRSSRTRERMNPQWELDETLGPVIGLAWVNPVLAVNFGFVWPCLVPAGDFKTHLEGEGLLCDRDNRIWQISITPPKQSIMQPAYLPAPLLAWLRLLQMCEWLWLCQRLARVPQSGHEKVATKWPLLP